MVGGEWGFALGEEVVGFVQKVNRLAMESVREEGGGNVKLIAKAVDVVMLGGLEARIGEPLGRLKILTFNNLACILKRSGHLQMALRAVSFAIHLEEAAALPDDQKYDIVPTYLNRAAILSDLARHDRALEEIRRARGYVERIEREVEKRLKECGEEEVRRLEEKRHYGLYMKMLISYNTGVQKEHQKLMASAVAHYTEGKRLALAIDNQFMAAKLEEIIRSLRNYHRR